MSRRYYLAIVDKGKRDYGVAFPDLPGCVGTGRTVQAALADAEQALAMHIRGMVADGDELPEPSPPEAIKPDPEVKEVARAMVPVDVPGKTVRVNISVDENLLRDIDRAANEQGYTRSGFLAAAARRLIEA